VDVLCEDARRAVRTEALQRRLERDVWRTDDDVDAFGCDPTNLGRKLPRLVRALEHLPVSGDEHGAILLG